MHIERGLLPLAGLSAVREEKVVEGIAARLLVTMDALFEALRWSRGEVTWETADECVVDLPMLMARIDGLSPFERATLEHYFAGDGWER